jgi:methionyl-tRNA formyltransferase
MVSKMDAGDIALQEAVDIAPDDDLGSLHDRLAATGARMLATAARQLSMGTLLRTPQVEAAATFTKPVRKEDLRIDQQLRAKAIVDLVRSASPSPAAWTVFERKRLKVLKARADAPDAPDVSVDGPSIKASDGRVRLLRVIPEGKREMSGAEFARSIARPT